MPDLSNPDIWPAEPHGMAARRFDHMQFNGTDVPRTLEFFTTVLDFCLTERWRRTTARRVASGCLAG